MSIGETPDILGMSDEDFLKQNGPPVVEATGGTEGDQGAQNQGDQGQQADEGDQGTEGQGSTEGEGQGEAGEGGEQGEAGEGEGTQEGEQGDPDKKKVEGQQDDAGKDGKDGGNLATQDKSQEQGEAGKGKESGKADASAGSKTEGQDTPPDYKSFYEKVNSTLRANGKNIEIRTPEEAIQLMQQGANYTRKMQQLAPYRKLMLMLENNQLLDEDRISFLIDIDKKNPEAIKKLLKDSGIDPMDIDLKVEPTYQRGNHRVSDEETGFRAVLDDLGSTPEGKETLTVINTAWDQASKEVLWKDPSVMSLIHEHRGNGIYDRVSSEVERRRTLGQIPANVPFLQAYKVIGDELAAAGAFGQQTKQAPAQRQEPAQPATPAAKKVIPAKPAASNGDKVGAASQTRSSARKADTTVNPLSLSDDEFLKTMQGRL